MIRLLLVALALPTTQAAAADRTIAIGSFDRLRIDGGFDVRIATGRSPRATVSGDPRATDLVDMRVEGTTLYLHRRGGAAQTAAGPVVVMLSAQALVSATMLGSGSLAISGMRGQRVDLSVAGTGTIAVEGLDTTQANASIIGDGRITLAGRAIHVRLLTNGAGTIDAAKLVADDVTVRLDGAGETLAHARYTAALTATGPGKIAVTGNPRCQVRAPSARSIVCGR